MPERIGRYRIQRLIGRGAMGMVYAAVDEAMGRVVAVKVLMADLESAPETRARFHREAQAAARLVHPNIITIFDAGEDQGRSYIVMQLLEGWPLVDYLKQPESASLDRKLDLMVQICEGLTAAHGAGVIHRDLKPNNLFVQTDGLLKIYDFGVARLAESSMTAAGAMLGTPDYMSPEQARGEQVDARSDIFSAGAVFYYILSGHKPFPGRDLPAVLHQLQFDEPAPLGPSNVPPELAAVVLQAMAKSVADRPPRVQDLLGSLVRFRRQYQAETRRLAAAARTRFDALEKISSEVLAAGGTLGLQHDSDAPFADRLAALTARVRLELDPATIDRSPVTALLHELEAERQRLSTELEQRRTQAAQMDLGREQADAGNSRGALRQFEEVLTVYPGAARVRDLAESCRARVREQEELERRVAELLASARRFLESADWDSARRTCEQVLIIWPHHEGATALQSEIDEAKERDRQAKALELQRLLDATAREIEAGHFDAAETALKTAERYKPDAPAINDLRRRLTEAQASAEALRLLQEAEADEIRLARAAFRRGRYDEAVQQLQAFLEVEPQARAVDAELQHLVSLRRELSSSSAVRHRQAQSLLSSARMLAEQDDLAGALTQVRAALLADPMDLEAAALLDDLLDRELQHRLAESHNRTVDQRFADAEPLLAAARDALSRGYLTIALNAGMAACRIAPQRADAALFTEEVRRTIELEDTEPFALGDAPLAQPQFTAEIQAPPLTRQEATRARGFVQTLADLFRGRTSNG
jgi:tetratricopeptide (TPR) repeat protein